MDDKNRKILLLEEESNQIKIEKNQNMHNHNEDMKNKIEELKSGYEIKIKELSSKLEHYKEMISKRKDKV